MGQLEQVGGVDSWTPRGLFGDGRFSTLAEEDATDPPPSPVFGDLDTLRHIRDARVDALAVAHLTERNH